MAFRKRQEYELMNRQKAKINHMMEELEHTRHQMMKHESKMASLQEKRHKLEAERMEMRKYRENYSEDGRDIDMEPFMRHYSDITESYHSVRSKLEESKERYQELQRRTMQLEHELARHMKYIEQENAADS